MKWTPEADELMTALWAQGLSMTAIAGEMVKAGHDVNRNMVAGRKNKLAAQGVEFQARVNPFGKTRSVAPKADTGIIVPATAVTHDNGVEYLKLGSDGCKAILDKRGSDGLLMCCGKPRMQSSSYCLRHDQLYRSHIGKGPFHHGKASEARGA